MKNKFTLEQLEQARLQIRIQDYLKDTEANDIKHGLTRIIREVTDIDPRTTIAIRRIFLDVVEIQSGEVYIDLDEVREIIEKENVALPANPKSK